MTGWSWFEDRKNGARRNEWRWKRNQRKKVRIEHKNTTSLWCKTKTKTKLNVHIIINNLVDINKNNLLMLWHVHITIFFTNKNKFRLNNNIESKMTFWKWRAGHWIVCILSIWIVKIICGESSQSWVDGVSKFRHDKIFTLSNPWIKLTNNNNKSFWWFNVITIIHY